MPFLRLNGFTIPVAAGSVTPRFLEIGERARSFAGGLLTDRRARKRIWGMTATPQKELDAKAIEGLIAGLGHTWPYDYSDTARLTEDQFSSKGAGPAASSIGALRFGTAADGDPVVDESGKNESQYGNGSVAVEVATTNLLGANQRDVETDTSGFTALGGASIAADTNDFLQGSQSLSCVAFAINDGVETDNVSATSSQDHSAAVYIKSTTTRSYKVKLVTNSSADAVKTITLTANKWTRVTVSKTLDAVDNVIKVQIISNAAGTAIFFVDALQIEQNTSATTWADPSRTAGNLEYSPGIVTEFSDITVNLWAKRAGTGGSGTESLFTIKTNPSGKIEAFYVTGANRIDLVTINDAGNPQETLTSPAGFFDGNWEMLTVVMRRNPETGENQKEIYKDAALIANSTPGLSDLPTLPNTTNVYVGNNAGSNLFGGLIDDLTVVPFAAPGSLITSWFNMGKAMSSLPRLFADGDFIPDDDLTLLVEGQVDRSPHLGAQLGGSFRNNARTIEFTLEEI